MEPLKLEELDLYEILDIEPSCSIIEVKKAYRKKALQCHPDKNPDNPDAAKEFHKLTKVLEVLTDEQARKAYDRVLRGRKEAAIRHKTLDSKRKKLKEDLECRERIYNSKGQKSEKTPDQELKEEIERLRKEGSKAMQEEVQFVLNQVKDEQGKHYDASTYRIKIRWKAAKNDESNGGYTKELIHKFLSKYGDVTALVLSSKKKGSAMVEFKSRSAAEMAVDLEKGLSVNPLTLEFVNRPPVLSFHL